MTSRIPRWLRTADRFLIETTRRIGVRGLRVSLGIVFIWFGGLKVFGASPVESLVTSTIFWLPPTVAVVGMGALEILVGLGLLTGWAIRLTLLAFFLQMAGTFAVFVILPGRMFLDGNPLLLTQEGEFVIKNLILVSAGLVVAGAIPKARPEQTVGAMLAQKARTTVVPATPRG